ncbi:hypothetical protein C1T17_10965 [Sphingobium sp. SCG-1]|uniref:hypothetical protein n=1 Tax=Sphingobium sp. SCG-1 TaxID=2072936 RepID=UPI000CD6B33F|nr:hypothetical protein [Sphingobium sp. SCG-1]AUW58541.1 hypothetical protein C1T17_10965 [Sphingobium sp. SCG-1]
MSTRTSECLLVAALLLMSGCDQQGGAAVAKVDPDAPDTVRCQLAGSVKPEPVCRIEVAGNLLTIRHPDGGFRRFRIVTDGRGLIAADGAAVAGVTIREPNHIAVDVDGDLYDLPATFASVQ